MKFDDYLDVKEGGNRWGSFIEVKGKLFDIKEESIEDLQNSLRESWRGYSANQIRKDLTDIYGVKCGNWKSSTRKKDFCFFDIENCISKNSPVFSIAYSRPNEMDFDLNVLFARDPLEERPIIYEFLSRVKKEDILFCYNKGADITRLSGRAGAQVLRWENGNKNGSFSELKKDWSDRYVDLLPPSRRKFIKEQKVLDSAKLSEVEKVVLGFTRSMDFSGARISRLWPEYYQGIGDAERNEGKLVRGIKHNLYDVAVLPSVLMKLLED